MFSNGCYAWANFLVISPPTKSYNVSPYLPITNTKGTSQSPILSFHNPLAYPITNSNLQSFRVNAADNSRTKTSSIVCKDCDGNGIILCSQCKGNGVNSVDHFNGQFKAGGLCWLCRGKREILCGNCNGAGFIGGFMSTFDD